MVPGRKNTEALTSAPKLGIIFESPHKVYVGNLAWSVRPEDLRDHFTQFGTVVSARVLYDRKGGKNRVYGFISFSSAEELKAAIGASGSVYVSFYVLYLTVTCSISLGFGALKMRPFVCLMFSADNTQLWRLSLFFKIHFFPSHIFMSYAGVSWT